MKLIELFKQVVIGIPKTRLYEFDSDLETFKTQIRRNIGKYEESIETKGNFSGLNGSRLNLSWTRRLESVRYGYGSAYSTIKMKSNIVDVTENSIYLKSKFYYSDRYFFWVFYALLFITLPLNYIVHTFIFESEIIIKNWFFGIKLFAGIFAFLNVFFILVNWKNETIFKRTIFNNLKYKTVHNKLYRA